MIIFNYKTNLFRYFIYISILLVSLYIFTNLFPMEKENKNSNDILTSSIVYTNENTSINVDYPRFYNDNINEIVTDYLYGYIKNFKSHDSEKKVLDMNYELYYFKDYVNVVFNIENSLDNVKNHNILINLKTNRLEYITSAYDKEYLNNEINNLVSNKYSTEICDAIKKSNINNHTYVISDKKIDIYFNDIVLPKIDYILNVSIILSDDPVVESEGESFDVTKKYISFTFDDGPSKYTEDFINVLNSYGASATFFMLGNRMKYNEEIVKLVSSSSSEVGSHTYSHKYLTSLNKKEILNQINSTSILFNKITGKDIKYVRPPYGSYNDLVKETSVYPLILWDIDPKDWLTRDSNKTYNNVIKHACDGCIIVMHDLYPETLEAIKMILPKLNEMNYEVVSISKLAEYKNKTFTPGEVITKIK